MSETIEPSAASGGDATNRGAPQDPPKKPELAAAERRGPIRNGFESIGMAVLMAVLLKYFLLEAYVIPTPSMQPTMMGSPEAGESDRILVDKLYYLLHEPKRWNIVVFRYPVRQVQSYVKRIVGVGGDRIRIANGNLYDVAKDNKTLTILRKPGTIQRTLWREMYPMRRLLALHEGQDDPDPIPTKRDVFDTRFKAGRESRWSIDPDDGTFVGTADHRNHLEFSYNGVRNDYTDGYDLGVAEVLRKDHLDKGNFAVQDLAIEFELTPTNQPDKVTVDIRLFPLNITFALEIANGQGKLTATRTTMPTKSLASAAFPFEIGAGVPTRIRFEHRDDRLLAFRDGDEVARFDTDDLPVMTELAVDPAFAKAEGKTHGKAVPRIAVDGKGVSRFADVTIERDLHYTHSQLADDYLIEVPEGHFFMMGDNTLGSADGRDWTALRIGVDANGNIVDPETHADARVLWGNKRPKPFGSAEDPHDDDNPVPMQNVDRVVFVDEVGEIHPLHGKVDPKGWAQRSVTYPSGRVQFMTEPPFTPKQKPSRFVPRQHIQGRPIARFLRSIPGLKLTSWIR